METYSVIYDANDEGDAIGTVADGKHYIAGGTATVVSEKFSRPGYNFTGWNTAADGTGTSYEAGDSITIGDENVTLYAQWEPATAGYTVEHYWEKLGGGYELHENESGSGNIGETATAAPKTYTGFTYNPDAEGTAASASSPRAMRWS